MNAKPFLGLALALAVLGLLAVACGGGGGDEARIRIDKGLSVAALLPGATQTGGQAGDVEDTVVEFGSGGAAVGKEAISARGGDLSFGGGFAPFFAPAQQQGQTGISVQGFGSASVDADSALLELSFGSGYGYGNGTKPFPEPYPGSPPIPPGEETPIPPPSPRPITEADLQPVIDAIVGQGVARADIEFIASPYYDPYSSSATLRVTVGNVGNLGAIRQAAIDAAAGLQNIQFQYDGVSYTVSGCAALELAAMQAAVEDAGERGGAFAQALGVGLGPILGASHYIYSFYGPNPCDPGFGGFEGPYPVGGAPYAEGQPTEVQLVANVIITYASQ